MISWDLILLFQTYQPYTRTTTSNQKNIFLINAFNKINKMSCIKNLPVFIVSLNLNFLKLFLRELDRQWTILPGYHQRHTTL